ncbi:MAG: hypothetical protein ACI4GD_10460 [Lachnospiraceae bacterium]
MSMEISEKDKQIIYILAAIAILAAAFFFGFRNLSNQKNNYKAQAQEYNNEYAELIELQKNRDEYIAQTAQFLEDREAILNKYEKGYNQENMIKTLSDIETNDKIWFSSLKFNESEDAYEFTSEPGLVGVGNETVIEFEGTYEAFKNMLASLLNINSKTIIKSLEVSTDDLEDLLAGELTIAHYSLLDATTTEPVVDLPMDTGVANIFNSAYVRSNNLTNANAGSYILTDYDACLLINPDNSSLDAVIIGTTNDAKAKDSLSSDKNEATDVTIIFGGKNGKYTIAYKIGDTTYPAKNFEKGVTFKPGDSMDLLVVSSVRNGKNDKVSVNATLINNSDMKVGVLVTGDDTTSPRFNAVNREGDITIYR